MNLYLFPDPWMEASKNSPREKNGVPTLKASFVRQISEDCERARSSFRPSEVSVGLGIFFSGGDLVPKQHKPKRWFLSYFSQATYREKEKNDLIFLGWGKTQLFVEFFI